MINQEAQLGMFKAESHANSVHNGWSKRADDFLKNYALKHLRFMGEDVRIKAESQGFPQPPSLKAWGPVIVRARTRGIISHDGYRQVKNTKAHGATAHVWISLIHKDRTFNGFEI